MTQRADDLLHCALEHAPEPIADELRTALNASEDTDPLDVLYHVWRALDMTVERIVTDDLDPDEDMLLTYTHAATCRMVKLIEHHTGITRRDQYAYVSNPAIWAIPATYTGSIV